MQVEIISIGGEVLAGHTVNTNAAFLSRELVQLGFEVGRHVVLPDRIEAIRCALQEALSRADLVVVTGGLGPTIDDRTREGAQGLLGGETPLKNNIGTALGSFFHAGAKSLVLLPGVPREMESMFLHEALPLIEQHHPRTHPFLRRTVSLCLLKEVEVDPFLRELQQEFPTNQIGIYPSQGSLLLEFVGTCAASLDAMVEQTRRRFFSFVFDSPRHLIAEAVHGELIRQKKTLALAESCTGGALAARLTAIPDASLFFLGSLVVYSNDWKERFLQVSHTTLQNGGAVSLETVREMLQGIFNETDADFAIAVSGIAGPGGASRNKPVGTVCFGVAERGHKPDLGKLQGPANRASSIEWTVQTALGALWRLLVHHKQTFS